MHDSTFTNAIFEGADLTDAEFTTQEDVDGFEEQETKRNTDKTDNDEVYSEERTRPALPDFKNAQLANATLKNCNLKDAQNLYAGQLAGTDLTGARLPDHIKWDDDLRNIKDASDNARKTFYAMLGSVLAIATQGIPDASVLAAMKDKIPPGVLELPVIKTWVPLAWFNWSAPLILLFIYLYHQLKLRVVWRALADLPAYFPDGAPLYSKVYPWLMIGFARSHIRLLRGNRSKFPLDFWLQNPITVLLAWGIMPLTLYAFWWVYLPDADSWWCNLHFGLFIVSCGIGTGFYHLAKATLRAQETHIDQYKEDFRYREQASAIYKAIRAALTSLRKKR